LGCYEAAESAYLAEAVQPGDVFDMARELAITLCGPLSLKFMRLGSG